MRIIKRRSNDKYYAKCLDCWCRYGDFSDIPELVHNVNKRFSLPINAIVMELIQDETELDNLMATIMAVLSSPITDKTNGMLRRNSFHQAILKWLASVEHRDRRR